MDTILNMVAGKGYWKGDIERRSEADDGMIWWKYEGKGSSKGEQQVQRS